MPTPEELQMLANVSMPMPGAWPAFPPPAPAAAPKGSGKTNKTGTELSQKQQAYILGNRYNQPSDIAAMVEAANAIPGVSDVGAGADQLQALKDQLAANYKPQVDLTPLLALSDAWYGGNLRAAYKRPSTQAEHLATLANLQNSINDEKKAKANTMLSAFGRLPSGKEYYSSTIDAGQTQSQQISDPALHQQPKSPSALATPFEKAAESQRGKAYAQLVDASKEVDSQLQNVDVALEALKSYKAGGSDTGPKAAALGQLGGLAPETNELEAKLRAVNIKNMAATFQGMSKAIDSNAERRAWQHTQASLGNATPTNFGILLGQKALIMKGQEEAKAQQEYAEANGTLKGYRSPVLGHLEAVVSKSGEMSLVQKSAVPGLKKQGLMTVDEYVAKHYGGSAKAAPAAEPTVMMISPSGAEGPVKKSRVEAAKKAGYKVKGD